MDHKAFISQLEVFEINSSVVDDGFRLSLTSPADRYFLGSHTKQKIGITIIIALTQLQKFRWNRPRFEACLWRHSVD